MEGVVDVRIRQANAKDEDRPSRRAAPRVLCVFFKVGAPGARGRTDGNPGSEDLRVGEEARAQQ